MLKNLHIWIGSYIAQSARRVFSARPTRPVHVIFCIADHFEPRWGKVVVDKEIERTDKWLRNIVPALKKHKDADGKNPKWTLFYPIDEFTEPVFKKISDFCYSGLGEIEIHLHHDNDTDAGLREKLEKAKNIYSGYGHLARDKKTSEIRYGFVHGNWSLDNSRKDGRWCGVNNELEILSKTGCYADFTLPSWPSETQTKKINSIYYAKDTPKPKSHNTGVDVRSFANAQYDLPAKKVGANQIASLGSASLAMTDKTQSLRGAPSSNIFATKQSKEEIASPPTADRNDAGSTTPSLAMTEGPLRGLVTTKADLMLIQGPLALNWKRRKIENGEITLKNPPAEDRVDLWVNQHIGVTGKPDWVFVKVHTHGVQDDNLTNEHFKNLDAMFAYLESAYNDGSRYKLHYVSAREMYNIVKAGEAGEGGEPGNYRDYLLSVG